MKINLHLEVLKIFQLNFGLDSEKQSNEPKPLSAPENNSAVVEVQAEHIDAKKE